jgi:DNA repair protein RecN (Recombination protein N)
MIKRLLIHNLVLVDQGEISFGPHFNAITGETGSGKTALTEAIRLCLGERADFDLIRAGCDKAVLELYCDISSLPQIQARLEEAGLLTDDEMVIRRELLREGKSRALLNCRVVPLPLLQEIGALLIDVIGQHSSQALRSSEEQRHLVDLFGGLEGELAAFQESYTHERESLRRYEELKEKTQRQNEELWRFQFEELEKGEWREEEALFARYDKLSHAKEEAEKIGTLIHTLSTLLIPQLHKSIRLYNAPSCLPEALIACQETLRTLESQAEEELPSPELLSHLEGQLHELTTLAEDQQRAQEEWLSCQRATQQRAEVLTSCRKRAALALQAALTEQLQTLNMKGASLQIEVQPSPRSKSGDETLHLWLQANPGENPTLVKESASGGEVARLLFAIKTLLAAKNQTPTLLFDEIDANVGGKTATLMGQALKELGQHKQVICITHFPQVAARADTHVQVEKVEIDGRVTTRMIPLNAQESQQELIRMSGG